jgi:LuxR family transcriptional regulator, quorum-sensing system regulator BjaR1
MMRDELRLWGEIILRSHIQKRAFEIIDKIDSASGLDQIIGILSSAGNSFGYENFSIAGLPMPGETIDPYIMACGWPDEWSTRYREQNYVHEDPIIRQVRQASKPFMWADAPLNSSDVGAKKVLDEATEFGLVEGFAVPIYTTHGFQAIVTFGANELKLDKSEQAALHLVAIYAHQAIRTLLPNGGKNNGFWQLEKQLSLGEIECLKWIAAGKTACEVGIITGLSDRTVEHYIESVLRKLNATNRVQAVAEAIRYRVIA